MAVENKSGELVGGIRVRSEENGFAVDELITCTACEKANPPNRANCIYCGGGFVGFSLGAGPPRLDLRKLESWELGHNLILIEAPDETVADAVSKITASSAETVLGLFQAKAPVPIARLASMSEAEIAKEYLAGYGVRTTVIPDDLFKSFDPPQRLRRMTFDSDEVTLTSFNTGEARVFRPDDIQLIVRGTVTESRHESIEKTKRNRKNNVLSESITEGDEVLIDMYGADEAVSYRIRSTGFDFSGLGAAMVPLAAENITSLFRRLVEFSPQAKVVDEYDAIASVLASIWEPETRKDFRGLKKMGIWKTGSASVINTSNLEQFSKYSRLQRILL